MFLHRYIIVFLLSNRSDCRRFENSDLVPHLEVEQIGVSLGEKIAAKMSDFAAFGCVMRTLILH